MSTFWLLTVGETLPMLDPTARRMRTAMLTSALAERGHDVVWWNSSFDHVGKRQLFDRDTDVAWGSGASVRFLRTRGYARNLSVARFLAHEHMARRFLDRAGGERPPDLVFASMPTPELAAAATAYGKDRGVPVLVDIRDLWPDEFLVRLPSALRWLGEALCLPMTLSVRRAMRDATGVTAVSNSYLEWGLAHARRAKSDSDRLFMMGYPRGELQSEGLGPKLIRLGVDPTKKIFLFVSTFNTSVDISTLIEAARSLRVRSDMQIVLCGDGEGAEAFRSQARGLANLVMTGWLAKDEIAQLLSCAYAGLVAYKKGTMVSLPNKFFEYLSAGVPVFVNLASDARAIAEDNDCGLYYEAQNVGALAKAISDYVADESRRARQSFNAKRFFERECRAETVYGDLADFLEACVARKRMSAALVPASARDEDGVRV